MINRLIYKCIRCLRSERRQSLPGIKYSVNVSDCYNMNHTKRGQAIIINNKHFDPRLEMGTRKGTEIDAQNLDQMLSGMGFTSSIKDDCTAKNMTDIISEGMLLRHDNCLAMQKPVFFLKCITSEQHRPSHVNHSIHRLIFG